MIKCKVNRKKGGIAVKVKGKGGDIAMETISVVGTVVSKVQPESLRRKIADNLRSLLDELEPNATDEQNADTADTEGDED